jgi:RHS repeat-associated protein
MMVSTNIPTTRPTCASAALSVPVFQSVTVTVKDSTGAIQPELPVYVFNAGNYTGFNAVTDAQGQAVFNLPVNSYRFRADVHGHQYWSGEEGHCALPACTSAEVAVPRFGQVTIKVQYQNGEVLPEVPVYAFNGAVYSGISGVSDALGQVQLWLPEDNYRFRADQYELPFWSGSSDHCEVPGCQQVTLSTYAYGNDARQEQEILYTYDSLNRLTAADYSSGIFYHYSYDAAGNRLSQEMALNGEPIMTDYTYDDANRLTQVGEQAYTWDANGNLLDDGLRQYGYDAANRLTSLSEADMTYSYTYNGLGDRISQSVDGATETYQLDLNAGLTQVLSDGTNTYLYGNGRISQDTGEVVNTFLSDALGSVRTVVSGGEIILAHDYTPYGEELASAGSGASAYGYAGEWTDASGLQYLRARYYDPRMGRFVSKDSWDGFVSRPLSLNNWSYVENNPIKLVDPSGFIAESDGDDADNLISYLSATYNVQIKKDWGYVTIPIPYTKSQTACVWQDGNWESIKELNLVKQAIEMISPGKMSLVQFKAAFGQTSIFRWNVQNIRAFSLPGVLREIYGDGMVFPDYLFSYSDEYAQSGIIHEFGHIWNYRTNNQLSKGLIEQLGTWTCTFDPQDLSKIKCWDPYNPTIIPGLAGVEYPEFPPDTDIDCKSSPPNTRNNNPKCRVFPYASTNGIGELITGPGEEDWATSFSYFVFPKQNPRSIGLGPIRDSYVQNQINQIP